MGLRIPAPQAISGVRVLSGSKEYNVSEQRFLKARGITAVPVVPNLGHPVVSRENIACILVPIENRKQFLRFANDIVDNENIIYVFLSWCEKHDKHDRQ
jgi:hypothetical protein